ncbi:MAG: hypothetical protein A2Z37_08825 [Chloroflexi bacterium RBG_19FT_COMBO_62_14]|nr:MAG: hypothetical protein A2Z37_08825 [Chloroflexi bacterium RBG_19FT_COMBO_62_14]
MAQTRTSNFILYGVRLLGLVYTALGALGFLPFHFLNPLHQEGVGARYLLNLVAINTLHNLIHLAIGVSGLWAARELPSARLWGRIAGAVLLLLFVAGMWQAGLEGFPKDQMFLGFLPLNSPGHILHLMSGGLALYLGITARPSRQAGPSTG